uniref:Uncharacterized protein n=1 Tax=Physcomitrium patens TaxID=3218 RepID=A0A7I3ZCR5_PHYPA
MCKNRISKFKVKESMAHLEQSTCGLLQAGPTWLSPLLETEFFGYCKKHTTG